MRQVGGLILVGWLVCGTLDILEVLILTWLRSRGPAERVLQFRHFVPGE